jgi:hypothetical protein
MPGIHKFCFFQTNVGDAGYFSCHQNEATIKLHQAANLEAA